MAGATSSASGGSQAFGEKFTLVQKTYNCFKKRERRSKSRTVGLRGGYAQPWKLLYTFRPSLWRTATAAAQLLCPSPRQKPSGGISGSISAGAASSVMAQWGHPILDAHTSVTWAWAGPAPLDQTKWLLALFALRHPPPAPPFPPLPLGLGQLRKRLLSLGFAQAGLCPRVMLAAVRPPVLRGTQHRPVLVLLTQ